MNIITLALIVLSQQQNLIWVGDPTPAGTTLKVITTQAIVFSDETGKVRLIILNPDPNPIPPLTGKYGVALIAYQGVLNSNKIAKTQVIALAKAYRQAADNINATIAGVGNMSRNDAQNLLILKTHEALGTTLSSWTPILDTFVAHMKTIASRLSTAKELAEYYTEIAIGLEAAS